jgi:RNA processing factor Prp31
MFSYYLRLDKDLNTLCMRAKEWYSWHFPELARIITDNHVYTKIVDLLGVILYNFYLEGSEWNN